jgi:transcriptional regulator with XRE-family HTH domain
MSDYRSFSEIHESIKDTEAYELEELIVAVTQAIAERIEDRGLTQRALAERLGKSEVYVSQVLNGKPNMTLESIVKFAHALNCKVLAPAFVPIEAGEFTVSRNEASLDVRGNLYVVAAPTSAPRSERIGNVIYDRRFLAGGDLVYENAAVN